MKLNEEVKIDIDLPNFTPDLPDRTKTRYRLLKRPAVITTNILLETTISYLKLKFDQTGLR